MKTSRGISPILAVIVLLGISVVGGGILYGIQNQIMIVALNKMDLRVTDLSMEKDSGGSCYFHSTVYNSGTESIKSIHLKTTLDGGDDYDFEGKIRFGDSLVPGNFTEKSFFLSYTNFNCANFTVSDIYSVRFNATSLRGDSDISVIKALKIQNVALT